MLKINPMQSSWLGCIFCDIFHCIISAEILVLNTYGYILGNPGVTHSVPTAFIIDECSGYGMGHARVTEVDMGKNLQ